MGRSRVRRWFVLSAVTVLVGASASIVASAAAAPTPANVDVSPRKGNQSEAAVAVDPSNAQNVVIVSNEDTGTGLFMGVSHDGGTTWARSRFAQAGVFGTACCDPTMSWDDAGNLFLVWLDQHDFGAIPVALSTDAGDHWTLLTELHPTLPAVPAVALATRAGEPDPDGRPMPSVDQPTVSTGAGTVWIVWNNRGSLQAAGARIRGTGDIGAFHRRQDIPHTKRCSFGDIAVGPTGSVMQVCTRDLHTRPVTAKIRINVDPDGLGPGPFGSGRTVGITNVRQFDAIPPQASRTVDAETGLAWDRSGGAHDGRVVMIYTDEPKQESGNTEVMSVYSDDGGRSWSSPLRVNDAWVGAQFLPKIAVDQAGGVLVAAWHDTRNDRGDRGPGDTDGVKNDDAQLFMATSLDGGQTWSPNLQVSAGTSNAADAHNGIEYGDYIGLGVAQGVAHPGWADNSNATGDNPNGTLHRFDIYTAALTI
jgi:hypothetical protein